MIKLFKATDKLYSTNGDLVLNPTKAMVHKEDNGAFYFDLETPLDEKEYKGTAETGTSVEGTSFTLTDVDATKNAEITFLKGQTTQSGTPTPTSPIPVETTTGEQDIVVCGKNLLNTQYYENGSIDGSTGQNVSASYNARGNNYIPVKPNTTYSFFANTSCSNLRLSEYKQDKGHIQRDVVSNRASITITTTANTYFLRWSLNYNNSTELTQEIINSLDLMLFEGTSTTYETYTGNTYEINLGKNLLDFTTPLNTTANTTYSWQDNVLIVENTTGTYNQSYFDILNIVKNNPSKVMRLDVSSSTFTGNNPRVDLMIINNGTTSYQKLIETNGTINNYTIPSDTSNLTRVWLRVISNNSNTSQAGKVELNQPILHFGTQSTTYAPYKTPIELCKIGTYQDRIFKNTQDSPYYDSNLNENEWYLHKEVGKVVLNGSEDGWGGNSPTTGVYRFYRTIDDILEYTDTSRHIDRFLSNYFKGNIANAVGYQYQYQKQLFFQMDSNTYSTVQTWKTWLSTHNLIVYYVLATPTNTLIEDEELINQLNGVNLLNGLNNISVSSANQPAILGLHYNFKNAYSNSIKYIDYLVPNNILVANTPQGEQAFRISNVEKTRRKIKIKANHVFYDSANLLIEDSYVVDKNCNDALDHLNNATSDTSPFTTISNVNHIDSYRCVRKSLYEAVQVVIERWGGHLTRDNWTFGIYDTIGQDNGVTIRYAKNLKDISATYDWNDVVTKLLPVGKNGILLNDLDPTASLYVESATQYDIPYTKTISFEQNEIEEDDFKDEDGELDEQSYKQALIDDLYSKAIEYVTNNYLPKVNYTLQANVEKVSDVGDSIEVIDEKLGINIMTNIISYDYDCILERYTQLEFGNFKPTLSDLMTQISVSTTDLITENNETLQITLGEELTEATDKIWNALGNSYVIYEGDKILVVDTLPKENATNVIMINNGGIAFSNSGINGTFSSAWTIDNVLNMENINVINLTADLIKGGTLKLGSNLNQNGKIEVFDEANTLIAELNKNGLKMYGADGSYVLMNNTVGFAGYDKNNTPIYWVSKDEFHMKKAAAEEEITLVGKVRIIPITIRDGNNNIVNDGIGFVNVGGGV